MVPVQLWSRRSLVAGVGALALAACGKKDDPAKAEAKAAAKAGPNTIEAAVAGGWRLPADRARDVWRHPVESLKFWELKPGQTGEPKEFLDYLNGKIAKWWMPDAVAFVDDIPLGATGKIDKKVVREQFKDYRLPGA